MSDTLPTQSNRLWSTPMRDLLRGRITGRLDWKFRLKTAGLPSPVTELIGGIVKRTRLWRAEKVAIVDELIAHFKDGLEAGGTADEMMDKFGDPRAAAKLIRRAKRRNRPLVWHVWNFTIKFCGIVAGIYVVLIVRFCIGQPTPNVDYIARLNEPVLAAPDSDRAWPLWRKAIVAASDGPDGNGNLSFSNVLGAGSDAPPSWSQKVDWLNHHQDAVALAQQAAAKPILGFIYGPGGSEIDPQLYPHLSDSSGKNSPLISVLLPQLSDVRRMASMLSVDARRGAELSDPARVEADLSALQGLARQLRGSDRFLVTQLVALRIDDLMIDRLQRTIFEHADLFSDGQLIGFAHGLAKPRVAGDLIQVSGERPFFADILQRIYTDDGHGDGRLTLKGVQTIPRLASVPNDQDWGMNNAMVVASPVPMLIATRAEMTKAYDGLMDQTEANFGQPIRTVDWAAFDSRIISVHRSPVGRMRYILVDMLLPSFERAQASCERYLGERDGTEVAIALEMYKRRHGSYPASLEALAPQWLPEIPVDRITGDPIKYRLINGRPVVYSVGADRIDDGGKRPVVKPGSNSNQDTAAQWDVKPADAPSGDWVLYPPKPADD